MYGTRHVLKLPASGMPPPKKKDNQKDLNRITPFI